MQNFSLETVARNNRCNLPRGVQLPSVFFLPTKSLLFPRNSLLLRSDNLRLHIDSLYYCIAAVYYCCSSGLQQPPHSASLLLLSNLLFFLSSAAVLALLQSLLFRGTMTKEEEILRERMRCLVNGIISYDFHAESCSFLFSASAHLYRCNNFDEVSDRARFFLFVSICKYLSVGGIRRC